MKQVISFVSIFCLAIGALSDSFATDAPFEVVAGQRQLFLDDAVIERIEKPSMKPPGSAFRGSMRARKWCR